MKKLLHPLVLAPVTALATAAVLLYPPAEAQQASASSPIALVGQGTAPELVTGLPDFTRLVQQVGAGVVSIEVKIGRRTAQGAGMDDPMMEIFRRFGMPMPPGMEPMPRGAVPRGTGMGTGFLISADGYVLTNHHVVDNAEEITVRLNDRRELKARLVGSDAQTDVALLKVEGSNLPALRLGESAKVRPGQWVVAIGSPFGLEHSVTAGIVSATGRNGGAGQQYVPFIQTDVAINRGNSGGPLLNTRGEVVGINSQILSASGGYQGISLAIPIDTAMNSVKQLQESGQVRRGYLGVNMQPLTQALARSLGLGDSRGALVNAVQPGSAAAQAGVQVGDVIRRFNDTDINETGDLPPLVGAMQPGQKVRLGVWREGRERSIEVTLGQVDTPDGSRPRADTPGETGSDSGTPESRMLGLRLVELTPAERRQWQIDAGRGVRVADIDARAAEESGIRRGEVILSVNLTPVGSTEAVRRALARVKAGDEVNLLVAGMPGRGGERLVTITAK